MGQMGGRLAFSLGSDFCRDSTLPVCNVLTTDHSQIGPWGGCVLKGIPLKGGEHLGNLGSIILCAIAILVSAGLWFFSERKKAAVGRREMQLFLLGFMIIEVAEIFSVGEFPLPDSVRIAFSGIHIGMIIATTWILLMNAIVGFQILDDGTPLSLGLITISAAILFVGTGYITLDTGFGWTGEFDSSYQSPNRNIALYVLYQLVPLIFLVAFYVLEAVLVLRILGEVRPLLYLTGAAILFALGQIFNYVISPYICDGTAGKIDGALFETLFTLLAVIMVWVFWSSITEDDWPTGVAASGYP
ncbi:putative chitin synthase export chaperone [Rosellinia necatrix]|uniref:Putative chitin synthase export chaperone n=1 Tax=Rosellinia necatrix TaxID=77044 RepID=A0A1W2TC77_ROSNE|nr:putative chitin synthase export chaperone [Rosellinia necatrix]